MKYLSKGDNLLVFNTIFAITYCFYKQNKSYH